MASTTALHPPAPRSERVPRTRKANLAIVLVSGGLFVAAFGIVLNFFTARSRDAVINATPIVVRSPIEGTVAALTLPPGSAVQTAQELMEVRNPLARRDQLTALETAWGTATTELADLRERETLQRSLLDRLRVDARRQRSLETRRDREELRETETALESNGKAIAFARREARRQEILLAQGAVAANVVDRAHTELLRLQSDRQGLEARRAAQRAVLQASEENLTLRSTRSSSDPAVRLQEEQLRLEKLQGDLRTQQRRVEGLAQQLAVARREWQERHRWIVRSPREAVVWQVQAQAGDRVRAMQPLVTLIDCSQRWLTTTVAENDLNRIRVGSRARIDLIGSRRQLRGEVVAIRSGLGRLQLGEEAPQPVPINLARESEVRVRILNEFPAPPSEFCFVGFSARVSFQS